MCSGTATAASGSSVSRVLWHPWLRAIGVVLVQAGAVLGSLCFVGTTSQDALAIEGGNKCGNDLQEALGRRCFYLSRSETRWLKRNMEEGRNVAAALCSLLPGGPVAKLFCTLGIGRISEELGDCVRAAVRRNRGVGFAVYIKQVGPYPVAYWDRCWVR